MINKIVDNYDITYEYVVKDKTISYIILRKSFDFIDIINVFTSSECRNQGCATLLFNKICNDYKNIKLMLEVNVNNKSAIDLYKKLGFEKINIRKNYYNNEDAIIMEKRL